MEAEYAGILGPLALVTLLVRGIKNGAGAETTFLTASIGLVVFAAIGYVAGKLAHSIVEESVRTRFRNELLEKKSS